MPDPDESAIQSAAEAESAPTPEPQPSATGAETAPEAAAPAEAQAPAAEAAPVEDEAQKRKPWFQTRIDQLTFEKNEERRQRAEMERQIAAYKALLGDGETAQPAEAPTTVPASEVERRATEIAANQRRADTFNDACNNVYDKGKAEFPDFDAKIQALAQAGVVDVSNPTFLEAAFASDEPAKVLHHLGSQPEEAMRIAALPPTRQAAEMTKLALKLASPTPAPVSKAPPPLQALQGSASRTFDLADPQSDIKTWMAERNKQLQKRSA